MRAARTYVTFAFLSTFGIAMSMADYVPFLRSIGLTLGQVALINGFFSAAVIAMDVPTSLAADRFGRARTLAVGAVIRFAGALAYLLARGLGSALTAEIVLGAGLAFESGALQAWLVDTLHAEGHGENIGGVLGRASAARGLAMMAGGAFGGWLGAWHLRAIWVPELLCAPVLVAFVRTRMRGRGDPAHRLPCTEAFARAIGALRAQRALRWIAACLFAFGLVAGINYFWAPYAERLFGRARLGLVFAGMCLASSIGGLLMPRLADAGMHDAAATAVSMGVAGLAMLALPLSGGRVGFLALLALHELPRGSFQPLTDRFIHRRVESAYRATAGSLHSFAAKAGFTVVPLVLWLADRRFLDGPDTIRLTWTVCGALLAAVAAVLWLLRPRGEP